MVNRKLAGGSMNMATIKHVILLVLSGAALAAQAGSAAAAGDAGSGLVLAKTWCNSCHVVAPNASGCSRTASIRSALNFCQSSGRIWRIRVIGRP